MTLMNVNDKLYLLRDNYDLIGICRFKVLEFVVTRLSGTNAWLKRVDFIQRETKVRLEDVVRDGYQTTPQAAVDLYLAEKRNRIHHLNKCIVRLGTDIDEMLTWIATGCLE